MPQNSLAREGRVSVETDNSLSRQGIAASCHDSECGVATEVGHYRAGQAKPNARDRAHGRHPVRAIERAQAGATRDCRDREALLRQTTKATLSRQS